MRQIPLFKVNMSPEAIEAAARVLASGYIGQGQEVELFEKDLKDYFNNNLVVTVNSGTSAEHLAFRLLSKQNTKTEKSEYGQAQHSWPGLHFGDEILCSPLTCMASNTPVIYEGYRIKWVDINPLTLNMDLEDLARKITENTKAIMLPFWGGMPVNMIRLKEIQDNAQRMFGFKPAVILDAAHAMDSKYNGRQISSFGHITTYSLQAIKHVTSIDGGIMVLPHQELYERARLLRWYGIRRDEIRTDFRCETDVEEIGGKFHMNDVCAAVGRANFKDVRSITGWHRSCAQYYNERLVDVDGVKLLTPEPLSDSSYWIYTIMVEQRDDFMRKMKEHGIMVSRVHERNDKHTALREYRSQLPALDEAIKSMCCIPCRALSDEDKVFIVEKIKEGW